MEINKKQNSIIFKKGDKSITEDVIVIKQIQKNGKIDLIIDLTDFSENLNLHIRHQHENKLHRVSSILKRSLKSIENELGGNFR